MKSENILNGAIGILVVCAIAVTTLRVADFLDAGKNPITISKTIRDPSRFARGGIHIGPRDAAVTLVEFADFECPACARFAMALDSVRATFPQDLSVRFRHYPLSQHVRAYSAALAAECANEFGRFEAFHEFMFRDPQTAATLSWEQIGDEAGIPDRRTFAKCIEEQRYAGRVIADTIAGHSLPIEGTPTFLVNDKLYVGAPPAKTLEHIIRKAMGR